MMKGRLREFSTVNLNQYQMRGWGSKIQNLCRRQMWQFPRYKAVRPTRSRVLMSIWGQYRGRRAILITSPCSAASSNSWLAPPHCASLTSSENKVTLTQNSLPKFIYDQKCGTIFFALKIPYLYRLRQGGHRRWDSQIRNTPTCPYHLLNAVSLD